MKTIFTALFALISICSFAQNGFVPGQYINFKGDTINTNINDQLSDPRFMEVKGDSEDQVQKIPASEIKSYSLLTGDIYESYTVKIDKTPTDPNRIEPDKESIIVEEKVLLKLLVKGAASLYYLLDESGKEHFFISHQSKTPQELIYQTTVKRVEGGTVVNSTPLYKGLLKVLFSDCEKVAARSFKVDYNIKYLKQITTAYNQCVSGSQGEYFSEEEKTVYQFMSLAGVSYNSLSVTKQEVSEAFYSSASALNLTAGVSLLALLPKTNKRFGVQADLLFKPFKAEGFMEEGEPTGNEYRHTRTSYDLGYFGINVSARYLLETHLKFKPYLRAGLTNNFALYDRSNVKEYRQYYTTENTTVKPLNRINKPEPGALFAVGIDTPKLVAECKYELGKGHSTFDKLETLKSSISFLVGYIFN